MDAVKEIALLCSIKTPEDYFLASSLGITENHFLKDGGFRDVWHFYARYVRDFNKIPPVELIQTNYPKFAPTAAHGEVRALSEGLRCKEKGAERRLFRTRCRSFSVPAQHDLAGLALFHQPGITQHHGLGTVEHDLHVGKLVLDGLKTADGFAELDAVLGIVQGDFKRLTRSSNASG